MKRKDDIEKQLDDYISEYNNQAGMFLCLNGEAKMRINDQIYKITRGQLFIISPLIILSKLSQSEQFSGIYILDELPVFYPIIHPIIDILINMRMRNNPCLQLNDNDINIIIERKSYIETKKQQLQDTVINEEKVIITKQIQLIEQETLLEVIQIYFRDKLVGQQRAVSKKELVIYNFLFLLHQKFLTERNVSYYANNACLSVGYFSTLVKKGIGKTPSELIATITIAHAKLLLKKNGITIKEVASELNFPEQFTFRKYFKQHVGISPKEYRDRFKSTTNIP